MHGNDVHCRGKTTEFKLRTAQNGEYMVDSLENFCRKHQTCADHRVNFCTELNDDEIYLGSVP